jgi:hypothetical protein
MVMNLSHPLGNYQPVEEEKTASNKTHYRSLMLMSIGNGVTIIRLPDITVCQPQ